MGAIMGAVRWKPLLLSLVPGLGHMYFRRYLAGVALFVVFAASLNGLLLVVLWRGELGGRWAWVSAAGAIGAWAASVSWVVRRAVLVDWQALQARRDEIVRAALVHHLRGEHNEALTRLEEALQLGPEPARAEILVFMAAVCRELGDLRRARLLLRRSAAWDIEGEWALERERQWALLAGGDGAPAGGAAPAQIRLPLRSWTASEGAESGAVQGL